MTNYYLDTVNGNDASNGTTQALAKVTLAGGLGLLAADDTLLIANGSTFAVVGTIPDDGITLKNYVVDRSISGCEAFVVSHAPPTWDMAVDQLGLTWAQVAGQNAYKATLAVAHQNTSTLYVRFTDVNGNGPWGGVRNTNLKGEAAGGGLYKWDISADGTTIYVGAPAAAAPDTLYGSIEQFYANSCILADGKDNLTIHGMRFRHFGYSGTTSGAIYGVDAGNPATLTANVQYCEFESGIKVNMLGILSDVPAVRFLPYKYVNIYNCLFIDCPVGFQSSTAFAGAHTHTVRNCAFVGVVQPFSFEVAAGTLELRYGDNMFYGVKAYDGIVGGAAGVPTETDLGGNLFDVKAHLETGSRYARAMANISIDDVGYETTCAAFVDTVIAEFNRLGRSKCRPSVGVVTHGAFMDAALITKMIGWQADGVEVANHSVSHTGYIATGEGIGTYTDDEWFQAFTCQYTGAIAAARMSVTSTTLTVETNDGGWADVLVHTLTDSTLAEVVAAIDGISADFTATILVPSGFQSIAQKGLCYGTCLADLSEQDIKTAAYKALMNRTRLWADEMGKATTWLAANVPGSASKAFIWPFGIIQGQNSAGQLATILEAVTNSLTVGREAFITQYAGAHRYDMTFEGGLSIHQVGCQQMTQTTRDTVRANVRQLLGWGEVTGMPITFYCHATDAAITAERVGWYLEAILDYGRYGSLADVGALLAGGSEVRPTYDSYSLNAQRVLDCRARSGSGTLEKGKIVGGLHDVAGTLDIRGNPTPNMLEDNTIFRSGGASGPTTAAKLAFSIHHATAALTITDYVVKDDGANTIDLTSGSFDTIAEVIAEIGANWAGYTVTGYGTVAGLDQCVLATDSSQLVNVAAQALVNTYFVKFYPVEAQPDVGPYEYMHGAGAKAARRHTR